MWHKSPSFPDFAASRCSVCSARCGAAPPPSLYSPYVLRVHSYNVRFSLHTSAFLIVPHVSFPLRLSICLQLQSRGLRLLILQSVPARWIVLDARGFAVGSARQRGASRSLDCDGVVCIFRLLPYGLDLPRKHRRTDQIKPDQIRPLDSIQAGLGLGFDSSSPKDSKRTSFRLPFAAAAAVLPGLST